MIKLHIDDFIKMTFQEVYDQFFHEGMEVEVMCADGPVVLLGADLAYSQAYMLYLRDFQELKRDSKYLYKSTQYTGNTHPELCSLFVVDIYHFYNYGTLLDEIVRPSKERVTMEELGRYTYQITEDLYRNALILTPRYTTTFDAVDIIEAANNEPTKRLREKKKVSQLDIQRTYKEITSTLFNDPSYDDNAFVSSVRTGQANVGQIMKNISVVGYMTEVNDEIFPNPILGNYATGITNIADKAMDSRSDAKSRYTNDKLLASAEYRNRELQIVALATEEWQEMDCGSTNYVPLKIPKKTYNKNSFKDFIGMYYLDETDNVLKRVLPWHEEKLAGKTLKFRHILTCQHPNPHKTCRYCIGDTSMNITRGDSVGVHCVYSVTGVIEQSMLSLKHLDASSTASGFIATEKDLRYINVDNDSRMIFIADRLRNENLKIVLSIDRASCINIGDVVKVTKLSELNESYLSSLVKLRVKVTNNVNSFHTELEEIRVGDEGRQSHLSRALLGHIKEKGWSIDNKDNVEIDLTGFDFDKPLFILPNQHLSSSTYFKTVINLIKTVGTRHASNISNGMSFNESVGKIIMETYNLIGEKFSFNIAIYGGIYKGLLVAKRKEGELFQNYRLPIPGVDEPTFENLNKVIGVRSLAAKLSHEGINKILTSTELYAPGIHAYHPFDAIYDDVESSDGIPIKRDY